MSLIEAQHYSSEYQRLHAVSESKVRSTATVDTPEELVYEKPCSSENWKVAHDIAPTRTDHKEEVDRFRSHCQHSKVDCELWNARMKAFETIIAEKRAVKVQGHEAVPQDLLGRMKLKGDAQVRIEDEEQDKEVHENKLRESMAIKTNSNLKTSVSMFSKIETGKRSKRSMTARMRNQMDAE